MGGFQDYGENILCFLHSNRLFLFDFLEVSIDKTECFQLLRHQKLQLNFIVFAHNHTNQTSELHLENCDYTVTFTQRILLILMIVPAIRRESLKHSRFLLFHFPG